MAAVVRAVLLDSEARNMSAGVDANFGKLREPIIRMTGVMRALNATSTNGLWPINSTSASTSLGQSPMSSPSVFNFFRPGYSPAGAVGDAGMVAPEFQILNAISSISVPNYYYWVVRQGFNRWGEQNAANAVMPQLKIEMSLYNNVPALLRRLDLVLTGGTLSPVQHQIIREAVEAIHDTMWDWKRERVYLAIYLIAAAPEAAILH
jgi:hypothetical protein